MKKIILILYLFSFLVMKTANAQVPVLYGMTSEGGKYGYGAIIKINGNGENFDTLYSFNRKGNYVGYNPVGSLLNAGNGLLYGMTEYGGIEDAGVIFSFNTTTNIYTDLHDFNDTDGAWPHGNLIEASNGKLYGVTYSGGSPIGTEFGVIFSFDPSKNTFTTLHNFINPDGVTDTNGINPAGSLLLDGNYLYGLTSAGGDYTYGVIFSFNISDSTYSKLYDFNGIQGEVPNGSLVMATNNQLYGLTSSGGLYIQGKDTSTSNGVIFSFDPSSNSYTVVHNFSGAPNGNAPQGSLISAYDGNLYGMTELGDNNTGTNGTIFSLDPANNSFNIIHDFSGADGSMPYGSLVEGSDSVFYGMTRNGGDSAYGTIFKYSVPYDYFKSIADFNIIFGAAPYGDLTQVGTDTGSGINQLALINNQILLYPNPNSGEINISSTKSIDKLMVYDLFGQVIYVAQPKQTRFSFNINQSGMYFISITSEGETTTGKIVISR